MQHRQTGFVILPWMWMAGVGLMMMGGIYLLHKYHHRPPQAKKVQQQITMIQPQPPPPIPVEEPPPPEQEMIEEQAAEPIPENEPEPAPEQADAPVSETLGLDADATGNGDAFNLTANKNGRELLSGSAGNVLIWYGGRIQRQLEEGLQNLLADTAAMKADYQVLIDVWVDSDGHIKRCELANGSGKVEVDKAINAALLQLKSSIGKPPPENLPQPVRIKLTARI